MSARDAAIQVLQYDGKWVYASEVAKLHTSKEHLEHIRQDSS